MEIIFPEIIDLNHPEKYIFTLRVHPEQFSFTLYNPVDDGSFFFYEIPKEKDSDSFSVFKQLFFDNPFLGSPFKKTYIMNCNNEFTFIPTLLYQEEHNETFMRFNFSNPNGKLLSQSVHRQELTIIHQMEEQIYQFLYRSFVNPQFIHSVSPLISYFQSKSRLNNVNQMIVNIRGTELYIICFFHKHFQLGNLFKIRQIQDAMYFILYAWKQLKMDQLKDFIYICGDPEQKTLLMKELKSFIHNIIPINISSDAHFSGINTQIIPFELSSMSLCEL